MISEHASAEDYYTLVCLPERHSHSMRVADKCAEYELTFQPGTTGLMNLEPGPAGPLTTRAKADLMRSKDDIELSEAADQYTRLAVRELLSRLHRFDHIPKQVNQQ